MDTKREFSMLYVPKGNKTLKCMLKADYEKAYVRIFQEDKVSSFKQYFQVAWIDQRGERHWDSFKIYCDEEERDLLNEFKGISTLHKHVL